MPDCLPRALTIPALAILAVLGLAAPAQAITATTAPADLAAAAFRSPASFVDGSWDVPANATAAAVADEPIQGFPANGSTYIVLSSGKATLAPNASQADPRASSPNGGGTRGQAQDVAALRLNFTVPSGTNCVALKFRYLSEEYPEYVGKGYNDGFIAEVDPANPWTMVNHAISAPDNFAFMPGGAFVSINSATMTAQDAAGSVYDGGTQMLTAMQPVTPGTHGLVLSVWDDGDDQYDSAAFIDDIVIFNAMPGGCEPGAVVADSDVTAPETTIDTAPASTTGPDASVEFSSDESSSTFECRLDDGPWAGCLSPGSLTGLTSGSHTFAVRATDIAGNTDATPASTTWTVDATPPATSITSGPSGAVASSAAQLIFDADDAGASYECKLDDGGWAACTSPQDYTGLAEGAHTFDVRATDAYGNVDATPATSTWTVDTVAPTAAIDAGPAWLVSSSTASFTLSTDDESATLECRLDDGPWTACTSPHDLADLADGGHTLDVRAVDPAGNHSEVVTTAWSVDTTAPGAPAFDLTSAPASQSSDGSPKITFAGEPDATYECRLDGGAWAPCTSPLQLADLADGEHVLEVRQHDGAGNESPGTTWTWVVDRTPPAAPSILAGPAGTVDPGTTTAAFAFAAEPGATMQCRVDGGGWAPCSAAHDLAGLAPGSHVLEVRQIDAAGNVGGIARYAWTIATPKTAPAAETGPAPAPDRAPARAAPELTGHVGTAGPDGGGSPLAVVDGGSLAVGCDVAGGTLRRCTVDVLVGGHKVGTGTATFGAGTPGGRVVVRLTHSLRTRLQRSNRPLKATFVFRATAAGGGKALVTTRKAVLVPTARWVLPTDGLFETDSAQLRPKVRAYLRAIAPLLRGAKSVRCEGHTDLRGSLTHNQRLGRARATAVCRALRRLHVRTRLVAVSRGESRPRATNSTQLGRWLNRRVELRVIR